MKKLIILLGLLALAGCVTQSKPGTYTVDTASISNITAAASAINSASSGVNPYAAPIGTAIPLVSGLAGMASGLFALWKTRKAAK